MTEDVILLHTSFNTCERYGESWINISSILVAVIRWWRTACIQIATIIIRFQRAKNNWITIFVVLTLCIALHIMTHFVIRPWILDHCTVSFFFEILKQNLKNFYFEEMFLNTTCWVICVVVSNTVSNQQLPYRKLLDR